ncbi:MAG: ATP-binding protein [Deltaproteobacteria bacterium]|nr:ATP-binding protein [Deltaproteobacteria bacterium]
MEKESAPFNVLFAKLGDEDDEGLQQCLGRLGWQCTRVDGIEASISEAASSKSYDLIVTDFQLPTEQCLSWLRNVKGQNPYQPVIVVAKVPTLDEALQFLRAGATDFVAKPLDVALFEQIASRVLKSVSEDVAERRYGNLLEYEKRIYKARTRDLESGGFRLEILRRLRATGRIDAASSYQFGLAFQEALTNGVEHGNLELESALKDQFDADGWDMYTKLRRERLHMPQYADRLITIISEYDGKRLIVEIEDSGMGFDPKQKEQEIRQHLNVHGRGLPIMYGVLDKVEYEKGGRLVRLVKDLK